MAFTARQQQFIEAVKQYTPDTFLVEADDNRILAFGNLVVDAWNVVPPETGYTIDTCPLGWVNLMAWGSNVFAVLFQQQRWTLMDFDYSDMGLSIRLDRVTKLDSSYKNLVEMYKGQVIDAKHNVLMHQLAYGISTPKYQSQLGQFLKIGLGGSWSWGSP